MDVDRRFERAVLAELALSERRSRRHDPSHGARALTTEEVVAVDLLSAAGHLSPQVSVLNLARTLSKAPGRSGYLARVVARAAIEDLLEGARPEGEALAALALLPDPRLAT